MPQNMLFAHNIHFCYTKNATTFETHAKKRSAIIPYNNSPIIKKFFKNICDVIVKSSVINGINSYCYHLSQKILQ